MQNGRESLIVALDVSNEEKARALVAQLGESVSFYKVGKELFTAVGPDLVRDLVASGKKVFLDLKFHDIPNTVAGAVRSAASLGVSLLTVHASGGSKMLQAAAQAAAQSTAKPTVLAVTVLTSLASTDLENWPQRQRRSPGPPPCRTGHQRRMRRHRRLRPGSRIAYVRRSVAGFTLVTPGIRPAGAVAADQARVVTPEDAIRAGANFLVVGRPITAADDPRHAAQAIITAN